MHGGHRCLARGHARRVRLLYRLAESRLGADGRGARVLYLALFPMAFFLQAVYSEALFLLFTLAAFLAAERGRFLGAGVLTGLGRC